MTRPLRRADLLACLDPELREPAAVALDSLLPDDDNDDLSALLGYILLYFVWYELPVKWMVPPDELMEIVGATAALTRVVGRLRIADLIESDRTVRLHQLWRTDRSAARELLRESLVAAGIEPPDTNTLGWSEYLGPDEMSCIWTAHACWSRPSMPEHSCPAGHDGGRSRLSKSRPG